MTYYRYASSAQKHQRVALQRGGPHWILIVLPINVQHFTASLSMYSTSPLLYQCIALHRFFIDVQHFSSRVRRVVYETSLGCEPEAAWQHLMDKAKHRKYKTQWFPVWLIPSVTKHASLSALKIQIWTCYSSERLVRQSAVPSFSRKAGTSCFCFSSMNAHKLREQRGHMESTWSVRALPFDESAVKSAQREREEKKKGKVLGFNIPHHKSG